MLQFTAPFPLADQGPSSFNSGPLNPSQQWGPSIPCVARCILSDKTEPTTVRITNHSPAIFSQEGHHLITLLKLCVTEAILCVSKHSIPSLQPLQPPTAQTQGVFSPWRIEVHAWSEFIQPEEQQWLASEKWDYYCWRQLWKLAWSWDQMCVQLIPNIA